MPLSPTPNPVYVQQANGQVLVSWGASVGATSYDVQRSDDGTTYASVGTPTTLSFLDTTVTPGLNYFYQVAAVNGSGTGSYSTPQQVVPVTSGEMTLGQLRLLAQQKADRVNSNFVTLPEWNVYINQSAFELYDLLIQKYGNEYYVAEPLYITTDGTSQYPLPDGILYEGAAPFYKLLGVDLSLNVGQEAFVTLAKYEFISRNRYVYPQITTSLLGIAGLRYRILNNQLHFIPQPQSGQTLRVWYIPKMVSLLQDTDVVQGVSGWTEYIAVDAAIKALMKEESDVSALMAVKMALIDRIEAAAENRDAGQPEVISDTRRMTDLYGNGFGYGDGPNGGM